MRGRLAALAVGVSVATGCSPQSYVCQTSEQCNAGECQPSGYCSFPDERCESGQRYGAFAGDDLGGQCVEALPPAGSTGEFGTTGPPPNASTSLEPASSAGDSTPSTSSATGNDTSTSTSEGDGSSSSTGSEPLDPDLVAWWRLDDDPADGPLDSTANALHGTCEDCPTITPAVRGDGYRFTGNEVITVNEPDPFVADAFTISAWARIEALERPTSYHHIVTKPVGTGNRNSWEFFVVNSTSAILQFVVSNPTQGRVVATAAPALDTWFHIAGTYDGTMVRLYVDGVERGETTGPTKGLTWDDNPVVIGGDIDSEVLRTTFIGDIDDIQVYRRVLDDAELTALATAPARD